MLGPAPHLPSGPLVSAPSARPLHLAPPCLPAPTFSFSACSQRSFAPSLAITQFLPSARRAEPELPEEASELLVQRLAWPSRGSSPYPRVPPNSTQPQLPNHSACGPHGSRLHGQFTFLLPWTLRLSPLMPPPLGALPGLLPKPGPEAQLGFPRVLGLPLLAARHTEAPVCLSLLSHPTPRALGGQVTCSQLYSPRGEGGLVYGRCSTYVSN